MSRLDGVLCGGDLLVVMHALVPWDRLVLWCARHEKIPNEPLAQHCWNKLMDQPSA